MIRMIHVLPKSKCSAFDTAFFARKNLTFCYAYFIPLNFLHNLTGLVVSSPHPNFSHCTTKA